MTYFISQMLQYFDFYKSLLVEAPLIANHFHSSQYLVLVVTALKDLSKTALPQYSQHLVPVRKLIVLYHVVVASLIIIACRCPPCQIYGSKISNGTSTIKCDAT
jgi:hypothetical protein